MRTIKVGGTILRVMYAGVSPFTGLFKSQVYFDGLLLGQIADVLDGNGGIEYTDGEEKQTFSGYSVLTEISRVDEETAVVFLKKE